MKSKLSVIVLFTFVWTACHKNDTGGSGVSVSGKATLEVDLYHHQPMHVANVNVYLKKNATTFPGKHPALYEYTQVTGTNGQVEFKDLTNGNYYLYAIGFDPNYNDTVWGYSNGPVVIDNKPGETKDYYVTLNVSE